MTAAMKTLSPEVARPRAAKFAFVLGTVIAFGPMSIDLYLPALPTIAKHFGASSGATQLTLTCFLIGLMTGQVFYGPIADRFGRRRPLLFGCCLYTLASIGCALSWSIASLTAMRIAQAIGGCAGMVIPSSVVRDMFDARESARMYSMLMLVMGLAPITAPLIGGQLLLFFGWRALFWFLSAFGLFCLTLITFLLPETLPAERRNSSGISQAIRTYGRLLKDHRFVGYALTGGCVSAGLLSYIAGSPFVFIDLYGVAPQRYGWIFGANALGMVCVAQLNRRLLKWYKGDTILSAILSIIALSGISLAVIAATGAGGMVGLLVPLFVCIASGGLVFPNSAAAAMAPYGSMAGSASAVMGTVQFAVGASAGMLVGALQNGTALPMAGVIALCGISGITIFRRLAFGRQAPAAVPSVQRKSA
jgi:DHA1 family bicyclomycin/chloramphenicol resistance-like MFS transporter